MNPRSDSAFTLAELLVAVAILGLLVTLGWGNGGETLARLQVEAATRRLMAGLEQGRQQAEELGAGCALSLSDAGWQPSGDPGAAPCPAGGMPLSEGLMAGQLQLNHTFPPAVRFTANGLSIDGGTAVLSHPQTSLVRCVVVSPPLGVTRAGRYSGGAGGSPDAEQCRPDPNL